MIRIRNKKRFFLSILFLLLIVILIGGILISQYLKSGKEPLLPGELAVQTVLIPRGTSTSGIADILLTEGLIDDSLLFRVLSKWKGYEGSYQAGEYELSPGMAMEEIMEILLSGHDGVTRITIPEGLDLAGTTKRLESQGVIDSQAFLEEIRSGEFPYDFINSLPAGDNRLEGFLFPNTYEVFLDASEHEIIDKMLAQFDQVFTKERYDRAEELGMSMYEIIILASIIEREAVVPEDRPVIAGVFYNRLRIGMPLQSCATVQYILGEQKPVLSEQDTQIDSPYNTYLINGLPPTPICSPGLLSIDAALWPTKSDYLYFLAKGDGSHVFSITYDEHLRNKAKYID